MYSTMLRSQDYQTFRLRQALSHHLILTEIDNIRFCFHERHALGYLQFCDYLRLLL